MKLWDFITFVCFVITGLAVSGSVLILCKWLWVIVILAWGISCYRWLYLFHQEMENENKSQD